MQVDALELPGGVVADLTDAASEGFPSQRAFLVSADGEWMAYMHPGSHSVRLRNRGGEEIAVDGASGGDVRFSADGRHAAAVAGTNVVLVDLGARTQRRLGSLSGIRWIDWVRTGVVVLHEDDRGGDGLVLTLLPLRGPARTLATPASVTRLTAASRGTRVYWFGGGSAFSIEVARSGGAPRWLGRVDGIVRNAEASPSGDRVALLTDRGVVVLDADGRRTAYRPEHGLHSLWFRPDGSLAWASPSGATVLDGRRAYRLVAPGRDLTAMRAREVIVAAIGSDVVQWDPRSGRTDTLRSYDPATRIVTADAWDGGVVTWTSRTSYVGARPY